MTAVKLTDIPSTGDDLEDYVAALFQASGYFVEKSMIQRDVDEVLELDIVATTYEPGQARTVLVEVKGGGWGYSELFKVVGWMKYLGQPDGAFFVKEFDKSDPEVVKARMAGLGVSIVHVEDFGSACDVFAGAGFGAPVGDRMVALWRHSYQIERRLTKHVNQRFRSHPDKRGPSEAKAYQHLINNGTFFAQSPVESLDLLYTAYQAHPKLTLASALEEEGQEYDPHTWATNSAVLREALIEGKHPFLQACMFYEHRARLAILKAAVDYAVTHPEGRPDPRTDASGYFDLPSSFLSGLQWLWEQPTYHRYAVFWQQFLWGWGGFYLSDRTDAEFAWMAKYSGIPVGEVSTALQAFDKFFPTGESWLVSAGWSDVVQVKMTPIYSKGLGAHHRRQEYEDADLATLSSGKRYTRTDLAKWINCSVEFLA